MPTSPKVQWVKRKAGDARKFTVHAINRDGSVMLAEIRDKEVIGVPVSLPTGTRLQPEKGPSWIVLRQVGKAVVFNRTGVRVGMVFFLIP